MKTAHDPRHQKRVNVVRDLFAWQFNREAEIKHQETESIIKSIDKLDTIIQESATEWPLDQLNKIDLAILRLATYELIIDKTTPFRVIVDEAVEIAKDFSSESSPSFINGVLGKIIATNNIDKK